MERYPLCSPLSPHHILIVFITHFDYQKDMKDEGKRMSYKEYHGLNHLMMPCDPSVRDNLSTLDEYSIYFISFCFFFLLFVDYMILLSITPFYISLFLIYNQIRKAM